MYTSTTSNRTIAMTDSAVDRYTAVERPATATCTT